MVHFVDWSELVTTEDKIDKVQLGMTIKQVQGILGRPMQGYPVPKNKQVLWDADEGVVYVYFDSNGKVTAKGWYESPSRNSNGLKGLIRRWLAKLGL